MIRGCPLQLRTDAVAGWESWKSLGEGRGEEALLAQLGLEVQGGSGCCKHWGHPPCCRECFQRRLRLRAQRAKKSRSSSIKLQTCRRAHAKAAQSQVIFRSVHFPAELAAACAVCMLRWLSKEGTGRALIQSRRFRGAKAGRKITNFDTRCSLQVSPIITWQDVKVHRHDPEPNTRWLLHLLSHPFHTGRSGKPASGIPGNPGSCCYQAGRVALDSLELPPAGPAGGREERREGERVPLEKSAAAPGSGLDMLE